MGTKEPPNPSGRQAVGGASRGLTEKQVIGSAAVVAVMLLLGRLGGLVRDLIVAPLFGAGVEVDALVAARTVPDLVLTLVTTGAVSAGFLPGLFHLSKGEGRVPPEGVRAISVVANWLLLGTAAIALLGLLFPRTWIRLVTPGLDGQVEELAAHLLRVMVPVIVLVTVAALLGAYFNFRGRFALPSARALVTNVTVVALTLALARRIGITAVALGWTAGALVQVGLMAVASRSVGVQYRPASLSLRTPHVGYLWKMVVPVVVSQCLLYGRFLVERQFASWLPAGSLAYLNYSYRIGTAPMLIVANAITTVYLPVFSKQVARADLKGLQDSIVQSVSMLLLGVFPFVVAFVALAKPIISLLLQHGAFGAADTAATARLLQWYTLTLVGSSLVALCLQILYAQHRGSRSVLAVGAGIVVQVVATALLVGRLAVDGVAISTGLGLMASFGLLVVALSGTLSKGLWSTLAWRLLKIASAAAAMAVVLYGTRSLAHGAGVIVPLAIAGGIYLVALKLLRVPELETMLTRVLSFTRRRPG